MATMLSRLFIFHHFLSRVIIFVFFSNFCRARLKIWIVYAKINLICDFQTIRFYSFPKMKWKKNVEIDFTNIILLTWSNQWQKFNIIFKVDSKFMSNF